MGDAREELRRYLEQRRELGEREFLLDDLSVDDAMRLLGATRSSVPGSPARTETPSAPGEVVDWRVALRASGAEPPARGAAPSRESAGAPEAEGAREGTPRREAAAPNDAAPLAPAGLSVGAGLTSATGTAHLGAVGSLDAIAQVIGKCTRCPLYATATNPVPGEGNPEADLVFVGEAPGATEDETGRPFVGAAGQLLTKIIEAIDFKRPDVFIVNVLKHRPPGNRNPLPEEVTACSPFLVRQIELIRPKVIVALGTFAAQTLLETKLSIGKLRGQIHRYHGVPVIVTYHPAALLRNPAWKRPTWEDVQLARRVLDRAASGA